MRYRDGIVRIVATLLVALACGLTMAEDAVRTVRDFGAVGDGLTDDTRAIQAAIDSRSGDVFLPRGIYRISKTLLIELDTLGPTSITGTGTARIVMTGPGPALKFIGTHEGTADPSSVKPNVWQNQRMPTVDGIEIIGAHEKAVGIEATGTMQLVITRVNVREALHAIHLTERNRNVIVSNCHLYENRGVGLYLDNVNLHQINVTGCHISYNAGGGIVSRAGAVRNLHVSGCDVEGNMSPDSPPTANILLDSTGGTSGVAEVAIVGCTIQHSHDSPGSANIRVIGVDVGNIARGNVTIGDNVISDVPINVDLANTRGVTIVGNTFWKGHQHNLRVVGCSHVVVGPNTFERRPSTPQDAEVNNGLVFRDCRDITLTGLHVYDVRDATGALVLEKCRRFNVTDCTILDCRNAGIVLKDAAVGRVSDCLIRNDLPDVNGWQAVVTSGERDVMMCDNLLGEPR